MEIRYSDGRRTVVGGEEEARAALDAEYPDAVYGDAWEPHNRPASGRDTDRLLVWASEDDAGEPGTGDDGSHAVASMVRGVEEPE